ncbi:MAG: hypothetical protein J4F49_05330 [Rhodobacteraceae bacterium]|nr:hypothetical protein [Paracoccaceae bacterium]
MKYVWPTARCIVCGSRDNITTEHIIPDCVTGKLVADFLCKDCNSGFGHGAERIIKNDPKIRLSIESLVVEQPSLANKLQKRLLYQGHGKSRKFLGRMHNGKFVPNEKILEGEALICPEGRSLYHLKNLAKRKGRGTIPVTLDQLRCLPSDEPIEITSGLTVTKWYLHSIEPDLSGAEIDPIVPAKIAFEFLALHCKNGIYENPQQLASIRRQLVEGKLTGNDIHVQRLEAQNDRLFHGLVFEGNCPGARVQIRLFGSLAFRVEFSRFSVSSTRLCYTHDLLSGKEGMRVAL